MTYLSSVRDSCLLSLVLLLATAPAQAVHPFEGNPWKEGLQISTDISMASVNSLERVYDPTIAPGYLLSELDWQADLVMAGISTTIRHHRWSAGAGAWTSLDTVDGSMVDHDWLIPEIPAWSDQSMGEATLDMTSLDLFAGFSVIKRDALLLDVVLGYREDDLAWADFGGTYTYSTYGFRDDVGSFEDVTGITYDQILEIPYLGLHAHGRIQSSMILSSYVIYSPIAVVTATDYHILRGIHFVDSFEDAEYLAAGVQYTWKLDSGIFVGIALDYYNLEEVIGDEWVVEYGEYYEDGASTSMECLSASLSLGYAF